MILASGEGQATVVRTLIENGATVDLQSTVTWALVGVVCMRQLTCMVYCRWGVGFGVGMVWLAEG